MDLYAGGPEVRLIKVGDNTVSMAILRNNISSIRAGGPRQFSELRDRLILTVNDSDEAADILSELDNLRLEGSPLTNFPVVVAEPSQTIEDTLDRIQSVTDDRVIDRAVDQVSDVGPDEILEATSELVSATNKMFDLVADIPDVLSVGFVSTYADFGPENLRVSYNNLTDVNPQDTDLTTQGDLMEKLGMGAKWEMETGDEAIVCIFDTGYSEDLIDSSRVVGTFSGDGVGSVWAPSEGHGTMTAGAAAANKEDGVEFNGIAKESDVMLVRITDEQGQIRGDIIAEAWDWLMDRTDGNTALSDGKPIVTNHSYGTPICNSRPRAGACDTPDADIIRIANSTPMVTSTFAAGNEAMRCGHRLAGFTSGITGVNSLAEVITVGALRYDMADAQRYTSHGRGDCAPIADPKPNCSFPLPQVLYYGGEDGYKLKDMSQGFGGSTGGTSTAAPYMAGVIALMQSRSMKKNGEPIQTEEINSIIKSTSKPPRRTQVNVLPGITDSGWDARFGWGKINILEALKEV